MSSPIQTEPYVRIYWDQSTINPKDLQLAPAEIISALRIHAMQMTGHSWVPISIYLRSESEERVEEYAGFSIRGYSKSVIIDDLNDAIDDSLQETMFVSNSSTFNDTLNGLIIHSRIVHLVHLGADDLSAVITTSVHLFDLLHE